MHAEDAASPARRATVPHSGIDEAVALTGAVLLGMALVFWVAANWDGIGRLGQFAVLQTVVLLAFVVAAWAQDAGTGSLAGFGAQHPSVKHVQGVQGVQGVQHRWRTPASIVAFIALGGLLAYSGQTYQTGADAWALFAVWAALTVPLCVAVRRDLLWSGWALVALTAVSLWWAAMRGADGGFWSYPRPAPMLAAWAMAVFITMMLRSGWVPALRVRQSCQSSGATLQGPPVVAGRIALALTLALIVMGSIVGLGRGTWHGWLTSLAACAALALLGWQAMRTPRTPRTHRSFSAADAAGPDLLSLSALALAANVLLIGVIARALHEVFGGLLSSILLLLVLGLLALASLSVTGVALLRLARSDSAAATGAIGVAGVAGAAVEALQIDPRLVPARAHHEAARPWAVTLLMAAGAWLAVLPLAGVIVLVFGGWWEIWERGHLPLLVGIACLLGSLKLLLVGRRIGAVEGPKGPKGPEIVSYPALLLEQAAWPVMLLGLASMFFGTTQLAGAGTGMALMAALAVWVSLQTTQRSYRALLGAAAMLLIMGAALAWLPGAHGQRWALAPALVVHLAVVLVGGLLLRAHLQPGRTGRTTLALVVATPWAQGLLAGALVAALGAVAFWSGKTMLVPAAAGGYADMFMLALSGADPSKVLELAPLVWGSIGAGLTAVAGMLLQRWRGSLWSGSIGAPGAPGASTVVAGAGGAAPVSSSLYEQPWWLGTWVMLMALAVAIPGLGLALCAAALCLVLGWHRVAAWAAVVAAWVLGSFYYHLTLPLLSKAGLLALAGGALLALGLWGGGGLVRARAVPGSGAAVPACASPLILLAGAAALLAVNAGIIRNEHLIRTGAPVFIALAPVDPRSLVQGDYMALDFALPGTPPASDELRARHALAPVRLYVVGARDTSGVTVLRRYDDGAGALQAGEFRIRLTRKPGGWTVATNAWFFPEGQAQRWQAARYGEFRVDASGRALLVGLRGSGLKSL